MVLIDTSVWVAHLRDGEPRLADLLERRLVVMHPFVVGEIACGCLAARAETLELLQDLPAATVAQDAEVLGCIERHALHGKGIGYIDMHLLVATILTEGAQLWTLDKRLCAAATQLGCSYAAAGAH